MQTINKKQEGIMNKREKAIKETVAYLKSHNIRFEISFEDGTICVVTELKAHDAPNHRVEASVYFFSECMEVRAYYSALCAEIIRGSSHIDNLMRVLNYINSRVFLRCGDPSGLYRPHLLYTPRIYLAGDGTDDIVIITVINYDFYEVAPLETLDYITAFCPEYLDKLTAPIFLTLSGRLTVHEAAVLIDRIFGLN